MWLRNYFQTLFIKSKLRTSVDQQFYIQFFVVWPSQGLPKYIEIEVLITCFFFIKNSFKTKNNSRTSLSASFPTWFFKKLYLTLYSINWRNFIFWLSLLVQILGKMQIVIFCFPVCEVINFKINPSFLIKPFSYMTKRASIKIQIS